MKKYKLLKDFSPKQKAGTIVETNENGLLYLPLALGNTRLFSFFEIELFIKNGFMEEVKDEHSKLIGLTAYYDQLVEDIIVFRDCRITGFTYVGVHDKTHFIQSHDGKIRFSSDRIKVI